MAGGFLSELGLPTPDRDLGVGSASHAVQTAKVMMAFEEVCLAERPDLVVVVGDVNSTMAASLVAAKLVIPVAHVEAGLRSFDRTMPEEINRIVTDRLADLLLTPSPRRRREPARGGGAGRADPPRRQRDDRHAAPAPAAGDARARSRSDAGRRSPLRGADAASAVERRRSRDRSAASCEAVAAGRRADAGRVSGASAHARAADASSGSRTTSTARSLTEPLGYIDFLSLTSHARLILTDSGGLQEESTALGIPCLTLRENTERPVTVTDGTNRVVGTKTEDIVAGFDEALAATVAKRVRRALGRPCRRAHRRGADRIPVRMSRVRRTPAARVAEDAAPARVAPRRNGRGAVAAAVGARVSAPADASGRC